MGLALFAMNREVSTPAKIDREDECIEAFACLTSPASRLRGSLPFSVIIQINADAAFAAFL